MLKSTCNFLTLILVLALLSWPVLVAAGTRWQYSAAYQAALKANDRQACLIFLSWIGPAPEKAVAKIQFDDGNVYVAIVKVGSHYMAVDPKTDSLDFQSDPVSAVREVYKKGKVTITTVKAADLRTLPYHDD